MNGNVWEWVEDCWHDNYENAPSEARAWLSEDGGICPTRTRRGGSYRYDAESLRSAIRREGIQGAASAVLNLNGFRVARDITN
jgi:formylglycine-generating enzyme required for sulfatase activity